MRGRVAVLGLLLAGAAMAGPPDDPRLRAADADYRQGNYLAARVLAGEIARSAAVTPARRVEALTLAGRASTMLAEYPAALESLRAAGRIAQSARLRKATALALIYEGDVHERMKKHPEALESYRRGLRLLRLPQDAREARIALLQIGDIHVAAARFDDAQAAYEKALEHAHASADPGLVAQSLDYLGFFHRKLGAADRAIALHRRALEHAGMLSDPGDRARAAARAWNHLGLSQQLAASLSPSREDALGLLGQAIASERQALDAARQAPDRLRMGYVLRALAAMHRERAEASPGEARAEISHSLEHASEALDLAIEMKHPEWEGLALHAVGSALARSGRESEALAALDRAVALWERIGDLQALGGALRLRASEVHERRGESDAALVDYARAIDVLERIQASDEVSSLLVLRGRLLERVGDLAGARAAYQRAIDALESIRGRVSSDENRQAFLSRRQEPYEALIRLLLREAPRTGAEDRAHAFLASERTRGRALLDLMSRASTRMHAGVDAATLSRERALESRIAVLSRALSQARSTVEQARSRAELDAARTDLATFQDALARRYPEYGRLKNPQPLSIGALGERVLHRGELLLEYFLGRDDSYLFVVAADGVRLARPLGVDGERLAALVRRVREGVELGVSGEVERLARFDLAAAHELYQLLLAPAAADLAAATRVAIVPHGALFYLPFELLVSELLPGWDATGFRRFDAARYFVESTPPLRYALSASLLDPALRAEAPARSARADRVVAFVNPVARSAGRRPGGEALLATPLPHAEQEGERIRKVFGRSADVYAREGATRERFIADGGRYGRVLVSAHGIFDEDDPMQSGVVMANAQGSYALVTAEDLFNMRLGARLASFAACDIGLGRIRAGEGLLGLTRAAKYAGAQNLVVSLWSVDDRSTAGLMARFYEGARDGEEAQALRDSKRSLLRSAEGPAPGLSYAHPFFWAAFVLY